VRIIFVKILIFFSVLIFIVRVSYAASVNFDFSLKEHLVSENIKIPVSFSYLLLGYKDMDFLVKPMIGNGNVEIFNPERNLWVGNFSSTNLFPKLSKNMFIRFQNLKADRTYLWFEISDVWGGKKYITPKKYVWGEEIYDGYVEEVNYSLINYRDTTTETNKDPIEVRETTGSSPNFYLGFIETIPKEHCLYLSILVFFSSALFSFLYRKRESKKEMIQSISEDFKKLGSCNRNNDSYIRSIFGPRERDKTVCIWK
jgi:hypothetical protein